MSVCVGVLTISALINAAAVVIIFRGLWPRPEQASTHSRPEEP